MANLHMPTDVARVSLSGTYQTTHWANVFHIYAPGVSAATAPNQVEWLSIMAGLLSSNIHQQMSNALAVELASCVVYDGTGDVAFQTPGTATGTDTAQEWTGGVSAVISWLGTWSYRGGKPRTYVPGLTVSWEDGPGTLNGGRRTDLTTGAVDAIDAISTTSTTAAAASSLGVLLGNSPTSTGSFAPFTGALVRNQVGSQRRRNRNH